MKDNRTSLERALNALCVFVYVVAGTVGAFVGGLWATLGIGLAVLLFIGVWAARGKVALPPKNFSLFVFGTLILFAAEVPFSAHPEISTKVWLQLASIFVPLLLLTSREIQETAFPDCFIPVTAVHAMIGAVALGLEFKSGGFLLHKLKGPAAPLTEYNRGLAHLAILAFPLAASLWMTGRKKWAGAFVVAIIFPALLTESNTARLALVAGSACAVTAYFWPSLVCRGLSVLSVALMGWPFYARRVFTLYHDAVEAWHSSWRHRMEIWDNLSYRIGERPLFGWGLGTTHTLDVSQPHGSWYQALSLFGMPHAHNFIVELWVETGLAGLLCGLILMIWSLRRAATLSTPLRPFALGCWAAAVTVAMFGFDFWTDSLWGAFALSAFAFGMLQQRLERGIDGVDAQIR